MSTPANELQTGGVNNMPDTSQPPPSWQGPAQDDFGLTALKPYMQEGTWSIFLACVAWCVHWQDLFDEKPVQVDLKTLNLFAAPFVGMGDPNVWPIYQRFVSTLLLSECQDWFEEGNTYRKQNSLVWTMVKKLAPDLAQTSKGYMARKAVKDLLNGPMQTAFRK